MNQNATKPNVLCIGAGGHARVVVDLLHLLATQGKITIAGVVAPSPSPADVLGVPVIGGDADLPVLIGQTGATHFVVGVGTIRGGQRTRPDIFSAMLGHGLQPLTVIHPSASVSPFASIGDGSVVMAGAVVQAGAVVGRNAIVNSSASIDHDCTIGDHCHVAPGATISGGVQIGTASHIGAGAVIIQGLTVGTGATVGAGSTVLADCAPDSIVVGSPAKPIKR